MINLFCTNGKIFIWNAKDVLYLREQYHIVGSLVGCSPNKPFQTLHKWLPLQLMSEEARLLIDKNVGQLVSSPKEAPGSDVSEFHLKRRNDLCEEQIALLREHRQKEILENSDEIYEGKRRKYMEKLNKCKKSTNDVEQIAESPEQTLTTDDIPFDKESVIDEEISKIPKLSKDICMVQLFTECPWKKIVMQTQWKYPSNETERLRYSTFKDLWEKNYYLTSGTKFGGDFLAYKGDPFKCHALFIVVCFPKSKNFRPLDLVMYGRLGNQVKKTVLLATFNQNGNVDYISLKWAPQVD